ncbi:hypothetical protein NMY22_g11242 [Coprinellus aureogranulatus]|nr:hypothetical protein NMY22_g11242 [Coprinellus aureogranulatus]
MDGIQDASTDGDPSLSQQLPPKDDDWNSDLDSDDDDEEEDNDSDIDAEAEEIARRLGEQLWALNNATAATSETASVGQTNGAQLAIPETPSQHQQQPSSTEQGHTGTKGEDAALGTIRNILSILENDPPAKALLAATALPGLAQNVLGVLQQSVSTRSVAKPMRMPLSQALVELARCEQLFGDLRLSNAPAIQLDRGKRKRDELEEHTDPNARLAKRPYILEEDVQTQVVEACQTISQALSAAPSTTLDPALISSIQVPLHQVFLFAVTSSARVGPSTHALQEIGGLIQIIGVLSGIQIGQTSHQGQHTFGATPGHPWAPGQPAPPMTTDIGTASARSPKESYGPSAFPVHYLPCVVCQEPRYETAYTVA